VAENQAVGSPAKSRVGRTGAYRYGEPFQRLFPPKNPGKTRGRAGSRSMRPEAARPPDCGFLRVKPWGGVTQPRLQAPTAGQPARIASISNATILVIFDHRVNRRTGGVPCMGRPRYRQSSAALVRVGALPPWWPSSIYFFAVVPRPRRPRSSRIATNSPVTIRAQQHRPKRGKRLPHGRR